MQNRPRIEGAGSTSRLRESIGGSQPAPMQSSTAIAFRALIMLIVLISVPLFAIFGKNLPDVVKGLLEGRTLVLSPAPGSEQNPPVAAPAVPASNPFAQAGSYRAAPDSNPAGGAASPNVAATNPASLLNVGGATLMSGSAATPSAVNANPPAAPAPNQLQPVPASNTVAAAPLANIPAAGDTNQFVVAASPMPAADSSGNNVCAAATIMSAAAVTSAATVASGARPANFLSAPDAAAAPAAARETANRDVSMSNLPASGPADSVYAGKTNPMRDNGGQTATVTMDEKFRRAEMRLRELGATHYMLETWGADNSRYRFVCKMSIGGNAEVNRYFQAIDDSPWRAMETVLEQVEDWRARSQPQ